MELVRRIHTHVSTQLSLSRPFDYSNEETLATLQIKRRAIQTIHLYIVQSTRSGIRDTFLCKNGIHEHANCFQYIHTSLALTYYTHCVSF